MGKAMVCVVKLHMSNSIRVQDCIVVYFFIEPGALYQVLKCILFGLAIRPLCNIASVCWKFVLFITLIIYFIYLSSCFSFVIGEEKNAKRLWQSLFYLVLTTVQC